MKWRSLEEHAAEPGKRTLREIYAERKQLIAKYVPQDVQAVHARVVSDLKQSGIAERALRAGDVAPEFELPDGHGGRVRSADLLQRGALVICFIRGRWCPFCVGQMEAMDAAYPEIQKLGASLVAISPQTVHQSFLMADQHHLRFPLLSDSGNKVARKFGLVYRVAEDQQEIYRRAFINLPSINGDDTWELAIPAVFIVLSKAINHGGTQSECAQGTSSEQQNLIFCASTDPDYTQRPEPAEIIHSLAQLL
jgi:peroxiredoxin